MNILDKSHMRYNIDIDDDFAIDTRVAREQGSHLFGLTEQQKYVLGKLEAKRRMKPTRSGVYSTLRP